MSQLLSAHQAAELLGVKPDAIRAMQSRGVIRPATDGGRGVMRLYALEEVERVKSLRRGQRTMAMQILQVQEEQAPPPPPEPALELEPIDDYTRARYVIGPIRQAHELAQRSTRCLSRVLLESDALGDRRQRDLVEELICEGADWVQRIALALTVIREASE